MLAELLKALSVLGLSSTKFMMGTGLVMVYAYNFWVSFLLTFLGGMGGFFVFIVFSKSMLNLNRRWRAKRNLPLFTRHHRVLVKIRKNCGLPSIAFLTPIFLTVPVGTFMAVSLAPSRKSLFFYMTSAFLVWSLIFNGSFSWLGVDLQAWFWQIIGLD